MFFYCHLLTRSRWLNVYSNSIVIFRPRTTRSPFWATTKLLQKKDAGRLFGNLRANHNHQMHCPLPFHLLNSPNDGWKEMRKKTVTTTLCYVAAWRTLSIYVGSCRRRVCCSTLLLLFLLSQRPEQSFLCCKLYVSMLCAYELGQPNKQRLFEKRRHQVHHEDNGMLCLVLIFSGMKINPRKGVRHLARYLDSNRLSFCATYFLLFLWLCATVVCVIQPRFCFFFVCCARSWEFILFNHMLFVPFVRNSKSDNSIY